MSQINSGPPVVAPLLFERENVLTQATLTPLPTNVVRPSPGAEEGQSEDTRNTVQRNPGGAIGAIESFANKESRDIDAGKITKKNLKILPVNLHDIARKRLTEIRAATKLEDLKGSGNVLEELKHNRKGQHAIRINDKYRICFKWHRKTGAPPSVEIADYRHVNTKL